MDVLGDLVSRDRHADAVALRDAGRDRSYSYAEFCTSARKTGNFLRHLGVREGTTVGVADDPSPQAVRAFLGAALLGGATRFAPPAASDARAVVAPTADLDRYDLPPGGRRVGYGAPPDDPMAAHFERDVWSENPGFPETPLDPATTALETADGAHSHADVLAAARRAAADAGLEPGDEVAVRASLARPGSVAAGVVAPLLAGATVLLPDDETTGHVAVAAGRAPERRTVDPADAAP